MLRARTLLDQLAAERLGNSQGRAVKSHIIALGVVAAVLVNGCLKDPPPPSPGAAAAAAASSETELIVLPNNLVVQSARNKVIAVRREGEVAWELALPYGDTIVAPIVAGLNSIAYVRGGKGLYALAPDGKWAWSKPLENRSQQKSRNTDMPVSFPDSTVAIVVGDDIHRFDDQGTVKWRLTLPEGHVNGRLTAAMDGALVVPTTVGLYCITPDGNIAWRRTL
jgi:outer membrane protein assembly factor BamB